MKSFKIQGDENMFNAISTDFLSSCGTNNKIVGQRFEIQQHNETIGSIYFSADYAHIRGIEKAL